MEHMIAYICHQQLSVQYCIMKSQDIEIAIPSLCAKVPKPDSFLGWQIHYDEAIDACLSRILDDFLLAVYQQGVIIPHEQYGYL